MGYRIMVDSSLTVVNKWEHTEMFDYEAFNAKAAFEHDKLIQTNLKAKEDAAKRQKKNEELKQEYSRLKELYMKTLNDKRLRKDTRQSRLDDIIESMINIEELLCI